MKMFFASLLLLVALNGQSQELQARVVVNASHISSSVDKKIFFTLQNQLNNFLNSRKWTSDQFGPNEKINCNFLLTIETVISQNVYKATLEIQAARPVYNTTYQGSLVNYQDADVTFKYVEFQPIEFNDNRVQGNDALAANLTAVLAYYVYTIIAIDYDSFAPKGGDAYYQKAQNIISNAPEDGSISGWRSFDGLRNRYWLNENLVNPRNNIIHDVIYSYYRAGLDKMYESENEARANLLQALTQLQAFNQENPNTMIVQFLMETKANELIGLFKRGEAADRLKATDLLTQLDVANASRYRQELR